MAGSVMHDQFKKLLKASHGMVEGAAKERVIDHANRLLGLQH